MDEQEYQNYIIDVAGESVQRKEYIIGRESRYYLLTIKLTDLNYKVMLLDEHREIETEVTNYPSVRGSLENAKRSVIRLLLKYNPYCKFEEIGMVHFKEGRKDPWVKEDPHILKGIFEEEVAKWITLPANYEENIFLKDIPKNLILYGPPGTGKTYLTTELALKICGYWENNLRNNHNQAVKKFNELKMNGQVKFITFHQSYSYEDFIEGITAEVKGGNVSYKVKKGSFRDICESAKKPTFRQGQTIGNYKVGEIKGNIVSIVSPSGLSPIPIDLVEETSRNVIEGKVRLEDIGRGDKKELSSTKYDNFILGYKSILKALTTWYIDQLQNIKKENNYVLIIDEINRGNISKIFGELITLIEEDKRENFYVQLPYSKDNFTVPKNLYIIGTMNSTDKSIALMDIALRRRFEFKEILPNPALLTNKIISLQENEINLKVLLETLNKRIAYLLDKDHTLGHSFFLNIQNIQGLVNVFKNKLLPLLQEYFFNDWEKIALILGDNQKQDESLKIIQRDPEFNYSTLFGLEDDMYGDETIFRLNPYFGGSNEVDFKIIKTIINPRGSN